MFTDDPLRDFLNYSEEQERYMDKLPVCSMCGYHITDEDCYQIDGMTLCERCFDKYAEETYRVSVDKLLREGNNGNAV